MDFTLEFVPALLKGKRVDLYFIFSTLCFFNPLNGVIRSCDLKETIKEYGSRM